MTQVVLTPATLLQVFSHCAGAYPEEGCGLVHGSGRVHRCRNAQGDFHSLDPVQYPRDAREAYALSVRDAALLDASLSSDDPVRVVYHSHPDVGAYLSDEDVRAALVDGRPALPVAHLVVAVQRGTVVDARLYAFGDGAYAEVARFDPAGLPVAAEEELCR